MSAAWLLSGKRRSKTWLWEIVLHAVCWVRFLCDVILAHLQIDEGAPVRRIRKDLGCGLLVVLVWTCQGTKGHVRGDDSRKDFPGCRDWVLSPSVEAGEGEKKFDGTKIWQFWGTERGFSDVSEERQGRRFMTTKDRCYNGVWGISIPKKSWVNESLTTV